MTTQPDPPTPSVCCGLQRAGTWLPREGEPQVHACKLCPDSGSTYWRGEREQAADQG